jgi:hypothetical protein
MKKPAAGREHSTISTKACSGKGMKPAMARLTWAREIAVITLTEWSAVV